MGMPYVLVCEDILIGNQHSNDNILNNIQSECQQLISVSYAGTTQAKDKGEGVSS